MLLNMLIPLKGILLSRQGLMMEMSSDNEEHRPPQPAAHPCYVSNEHIWANLIPMGQQLRIRSHRQDDNQCNRISEKLAQIAR
jgi:hypothetical protein